MSQLHWINRIFYELESFLYCCLFGLRNWGKWGEGERGVDWLGEDPKWCRFENNIQFEENVTFTKPNLFSNPHLERWSQYISAWIVHLVPELPDSLFYNSLSLWTGIFRMHLKLGLHYSSTLDTDWREVSSNVVCPSFGFFQAGCLRYAVRVWFTGHGIKGFLSPVGSWLCFPYRWSGLQSDLSSRMVCRL